MPLAHDVAHSESSTPMRVAASLRQRLGAHRMDLWFGSDVRWSFNAPSEICIEVASQFVADCITRMFRDELTQSIEEVIGTGCGYRVTVAENSDTSASRGLESVPPRTTTAPSFYRTAHPTATGSALVHAPSPLPNPSHTSLATPRTAPPSSHTARENTIQQGVARASVPTESVGLPPSIPTTAQTLVTQPLVTSPYSLLNPQPSPNHPIAVAPVAINAPGFAQSQSISSADDDITPLIEAIRRANASLAPVASVVLPTVPTPEGEITVPQGTQSTLVLPAGEATPDVAIVSVQQDDLCATNSAEVADKNATPDSIEIVKLPQNEEHAEIAQPVLPVDEVELLDNSPSEQIEVQLPALVDIEATTPAEACPQLDLIAAEFNPNAQKSEVESHEDASTSGTVTIDANSVVVPPQHPTAIEESSFAQTSFDLSLVDESALADSAIQPESITAEFPGASPESNQAPAQLSAVSLRVDAVPAAPAVEATPTEASLEVANSSDAFSSEAIEVGSVAEVIQIASPESAVDDAGQANIADQTAVVDNLLLAESISAIPENLESETAASSVSEVEFDSAPRAVLQFPTQVSPVPTPSVPTPSVEQVEIPVAAPVLQQPVVQQPLQQQAVVPQQPISLFEQFTNAVAAAQAANLAASNDNAVSSEPANVAFASVGGSPATAAPVLGKTTGAASQAFSAPSVAAASGVVSAGPATIPFPTAPGSAPGQGASTGVHSQASAGRSASVANKPVSQPRLEAMSAVERLAEIRKEHERRWDDFIQGEHNRLAYTAATMVLEKPGQITPLFIHGPHGSGKSHLAIGLAHKLRSVYKMRRVLVLTGEQFTIEFTESARGGGFANFRRKYRDVDVLVIDDLQFCLGKAATLAELRNTIDMLLRDRRQVILVADRSLNELSGLTADLHARLAGGMTCGIEPLDLETRVRLLDQLCRQQNVILPSGSIRELAGQSAGDARVLQGLVHRLVAQQRMCGGELNHEQAIRCTLDLLRASQPVVRMNDIERVVCETFGLDDKALRGKTKAQTVSQPRMLAMFLARKYTRSALSEIGDYFGKRQHSTVISAHKKVESWINEDELIQCGRGRLSVKEILRNLESTLRVG